VGETIYADTTGASREPNEPFHHGTNAIHTLWYEFTAHETGGHYIERPFDFTPPGFSIYQGGGIGALTEVPQTVYATSDSRTIITFRAVAGQKYAIALHDHLERTNQFSMRIGVPRDEFENASEITLGAGDLFDALAATIQPGEAAIHEFQNSVWHRFTAPANGGYFAQTQDGGYPLVFRGNSFSNLVLATPLHRERYIYGFPFYASAGETLYIAVVDTAGYRLRVDAAAPNDQFINRAAVFSERMVSTNGWATLEPGEPVHSTNFRGGSLWWKWIATNSVPHRILATAGFAGALALYHGSELTNLTLVATAETFDFGLVGLDFIPNPGVEYAICLSYLPVWDNPVILTFQTPPPHDHFADAIPIVTGNPLTNVIGIASLEPSETWSTNKGTVWYKWTAHSSGPFAFLPGSSNYGFDIHVFTGSSIHNLDLVDSLFDGGYSSGVSFRAEEGTTYHIAVALPFSVSPHTIQPTIVAGPSNDDFANATELSGMYVAWSGTTAGATSEPGELNPSDYYTASVWAKWTAPTSAVFRIFGSQLTEVFRESSQMPFGSTTFEAQEGLTYWIKVAGSRDAMGPFYLRLGPNSTNNSPISATELQGTNLFFYPNFLTSVAQTSGVNGLWYKWTSPAHGMLTYSLITNDTSGKIAFFHMRRPTIHSNAVVQTANAPWRPASGSVAVAKDVTYLILLQSAPTTNIFLSLQLEDVQHLSEFSDIMNGGLAVPTVQSDMTYSPPDALQVGPLQSAQSAWIEKTFLGSGTLRYRVAAEGPGAYMSVAVSPAIWGVNYSLPHLPFNWTQHTVKLERDTNIVRWTLNNTFGATATATAWFDEFEFLPAEPLKPKISVYERTDRQFGFYFTVEAQRSTFIDSSTNLVDWSPWTNFISSRTTLRSFAAPLSAEAPPLFFRVRVSQ
jgi:hypothetical protein